ncbi:rhomboid family protein [Nitzschia inconspicua]|uniref:Rhomboid family protein n=1 Tax=Nitzschia inconspicua TaxID=303405 RepID=A0A9K3PYU9_9STRA|nr:rhomboid family protein [Nitzschia inconspicua]
MSSQNNSGPPSDNPILNTYETFQRETPFVTRTIITTQAFSWVLSFFVDLTFSLANIPFFTVVYFEVYRIFTSIFLCTKFVSLAFAYFSFVETGKRLENSIGSTEFAFMFLSIGGLTNALYCALGAILDAVLGTQHFFLLPSFGVWLVLFGLTEFECIKAPQGTTRKLFVFVIPTLYYPLALLGLFSVFGGFSFSYLISIGVGYAYGRSFLDRLKISSTRCRDWEENFLECITHSEGWVRANAALGSGAWNEELVNHGNSAAAGVGFANIFLDWMSQSHSRSPEAAALPMGSEDSRPGRVIKSSTSTTDTAPISGIPSTGGRQLGGGPSRRANADPRQARLNAIERRMGAGAGSEAHQST